MLFRSWEIQTKEIVAHESTLLLMDDVYASYETADRVRRTRMKQDIASLKYKIMTEFTFLEDLINKTRKIYGDDSTPDSKNTTLNLMFDGVIDTKLYFDKL